MASIQPSDTLCYHCQLTAGSGCSPQKLEELEKEEELREKAGFYDSDESSDEEMKEIRKVANK